MIILLVTFLSAIWFTGTCFSIAACVRKSKEGNSYYDGDGYIILAVFSVAIWPFLLGALVANYVLDAAARQAERARLVHMVAEGAKVERQQRERNLEKRENEALALEPEIPEGETQSSRYGGILRPGMRGE